MRRSNLERGSWLASERLREVSDFIVAETF